MIFNKGRPMIAQKVWGIDRFKKFEYMRYVKICEVFGNNLYFNGMTILCGGNGY